MPHSHALAGRYFTALASLLLLLLSGCSSVAIDPFGSSSNRNRNADVTLDLGTAAKLRDRVVVMSGTIRPDVFNGDAIGTVERYRVSLEYAVGTETTFKPATLLLAPGISLSDPIAFPVGVTSPFTIKWDRDADLKQDVEARVWLRLTLTQAEKGQGVGSVTRGPKEVDVRPGDGCADKTPRITNTSVLIPRNVPSTAVIQTEFGTRPLTFTINEPLPLGLTFESDGRITGTPSGPIGPILRLVTVTDNCQSRSDQAWITLAVP